LKLIIRRRCTGKTLVGILMGSESDLPVMKNAAEVLQEGTWKNAEIEKSRIFLEEHIHPEA
jgi:phosphoribosylcarboxyaminoimidazole (NCAIR) mutase